MKKLSLLLAVILLASCSSTNDKDLFDTASKKVNDKKYQEALSDFTRLVAENPGSEFASQALLECAKLYHNQLIDELSKEESLIKAVEFYTRVYKEYPKSKEAPPSMMTTGFVFANELIQLENAKSVYELFLETYPESELAKSVKIELENLGASPEEILQNSLGSDKK